MGRVPAWLAERMTKLGTAIAEAIHPRLWHFRVSFASQRSFWFQALAPGDGMDWHSSGITTSVMGALNVAWGPRERAGDIRSVAAAASFAQHAAGIASVPSAAALTAKSSGPHSG